jgi:hypothetical protein
LFALPPFDETQIAAARKRKQINVAVAINVARQNLPRIDDCVFASVLILKADESAFDQSPPKLRATAKPLSVLTIKSSKPSLS